jgi:CRISPR/Cas system-associated exonuclease Cas4 (RecB family)
MVAAMKKAEIQCAGARGGGAGGGAGANATGYDDDDGVVDDANDADATGYDDDDVGDVGAIAVVATADINYSVSVIVRKHKNHEPVSIAEFTYLVAIYMCSVDNIIHRVLQISNYNWISTATTERVMARMDSLKLESPMFENRMWGELCVDGVDYIINGINDCEDTDILYEFKFTEDLADEHELQLACYMWLYDKHFHTMVDEYQREIESPTIVRVGDEIEFNHDGKTNRGKVSKIFKNGNMDVMAVPAVAVAKPPPPPKRPVRAKKAKPIKISTADMTANITYASTPPVYKKRRGILYNSRTDEMREIKYDFDTVNEMIEMLLRIKKTNTVEITNEQFLRIIHSPYVG